MIVAKSSGTRFSWEFEKIGALRDVTGEMIGTVTEKAEVNELLSEQMQTCQLLSVPNFAWRKASTCAAWVFGSTSVQWCTTR